MMLTRKQVMKCSKVTSFEFEDMPFTFIFFKCAKFLSYLPMGDVQYMIKLVSFLNDMAFRIV